MHYARATPTARRRLSGARQSAPRRAYLGVPHIPLLLAIIALALLFALIQVGAVSIAFGKLGLTAGSGMLLLMSCIAGSLVNMPLFQMRANGEVRPNRPPMPMPWLQRFQQPFYGRTVVAINLGGAIIPVAFSLYLLATQSLPFVALVLAIAGQSAVCYVFSRPVPGLGIAMPVLVPPITAAVLAVTLGGEQSAPLAYIAGTLGVLIGADLMRVNDIRELGVPVASIGGAGTFDGVFITGIVAVLLA